MKLWIENIVTAALGFGKIPSESFRPDWASQFSSPCWWLPVIGDASWLSCKTASLWAFGDASDQLHSILGEQVAASRQQTMPAGNGFIQL
jgi:hypothetical protein